MEKKQGFCLNFIGNKTFNYNEIADKIKVNLESRGVLVEILNHDEIKRTMSSHGGNESPSESPPVALVGFLARVLTRNGISIIMTGFPDCGAITGSDDFLDLDLIEIGDPDGGRPMNEADVIGMLEASGRITSVQQEGYTDEERHLIEQRLRDLGYL